MRNNSRTNRRYIVGRGIAFVTAGSVLSIMGRSLAGQSATPGATPTRGSSTPAASPMATPAATDSTTVTMTFDLRFEPEHVVVGAGTTITWVNDSPMPHTATGDPNQNPVAGEHPEYIELPGSAGAWGSELLQPGESYAHTFTVPGDYRYICIPHVLSGMRGTIRVE